MSIVAKNCLDQRTQPMFASFNFINAGYSFFAVGAYLGIMVDSKHFGGTHKRINHTSAFKSILRLASNLLVTLFVLFLPSIVIPNDLNLFILYLFQVILPSTLIALYLFGFSKLFNRKLGLVKEEKYERDEDEEFFEDELDRRESRNT